MKIKMTKIVRYYFLRVFSLTETEFEPTTTSKWFSALQRGKLLWIRIPLQSFKFQLLRLFQATGFLTVRKLQIEDSL